MQAVKSSKMAVYQMIPRWMPYSTPIYIEPLKSVFERIRAKSDLEKPLEATLGEPTTEQAITTNATEVNRSTEDGKSKKSDLLSNICEQLKAVEETKSASEDTAAKLQLMTTGFMSSSSSNILNEPVATPHDYYQLKHRKSIHDIGGNPEQQLNYQTSKLTSSGGEMEGQNGSSSNKYSPTANKTMTVATVSEAFRK